VILALDAYSFDIVEPYVNQTAKDASERMLRAILAKLEPPPRPAAVPRAETGRLLCVRWAFLVYHCA
jgi:hypothetical protein